MADIKELKITEDKTRGKHVADLPVNPTENGMSAQELQEQFDALPEVVIAAFNTLLDYLVANGAGDKITAATVGALPLNDVGGVHNFRFYTALNQIGIPDTSTIEEIAVALPNNSYIAFSLWYSAYNETIYPSGSGVCEVLKKDNDRVIFRFTSLWKQTQTWFGEYFESGEPKWSGWKDISGDFRADGSVAMSGALSLKNNEVEGFASLEKNTNGAFNIYNRDESGATQGIRIWGSDIDLAKRLKFFDGTNFNNIFGEHNKELLASTIQSLIDSGVISMSAVKSVQRGVITLSTENSSNTATISSVNTSKAVVIYTGNTYGYAGSSPGASKEHYYLELTNSTTVTVKCATTVNAEVNVPYQVVEYV